MIIGTHGECFELDVLTSIQQNRQRRDTVSNSYCSTAKGVSLPNDRYAVPEALLRKPGDSSGVSRVQSMEARNAGYKQG